MQDSTFIDQTKRSLVLGGVSLSAFAVTGCCTVPAPQLSGLCSSATGTYLSGPEAQAAWAKPERYFDAHAHFFNAADVPVAGFLSKSVAHSIEDETLRSLLISLAPIAEVVGKAFAPSPKAEMDALCDLAGRASTMSLRAQSLDLDSAIDRRRQDTADSLFDEISRRDTPIPAIVNEAFQRTRTVRPNSLLLDRSGFSREFVRESVRRGSASAEPSTDRVRPMARSGIPPEEAQLASIQNVFQFVGFMLAPRHHNLRTYIRRFSEGSPSLPLSGCFGAMVDFNYWLDCPSKASVMRDQVLLHEQMALLSSGFLLPIVAYNPWVDIAEDDAGVKTVEWAVKEHGCVGVKIYPPMGFYPYGNADNPLVGSTEKRPDLKALDTKLAQFYAICQELDVPVMAHANESNGRDPVHDKLAGVKGWRLVDERVTNLRSLYVNAGHFGGAKVHGRDDWNADFVDLMRSARNTKVYADIAYWDELLTSLEVRERFARVLSQPIGSGESVADRTMYGSDWLMLSQVPGWEDYADGVANVVRGLDQTGSLAARVLGANAFECFGLTLDSGRQNLQRLKAYYSQPARSLPGWMVSAH